MGFEPKITRVSADARGEIYSISLPGNRELMLLHSVAGTMRGGHSHTVPEAVMVLSGKMRYHKLHHGEDAADLLMDGDWSTNAAGEVHMGEFIGDTWLIEWKIGTSKTGWQSVDYEPWRAKVRASASA